MVNTTAVHGGGVPRALIPNPNNRARALKTRGRKLYTLASFSDEDANGGCALGGVGAPAYWEFSNQSGTPQAARDLTSATWSLVGIKTSKGIQSLVGYVPLQTRSPYDTDPQCRNNYTP